MAWFSLASVLFYILSGCSWGPMKKAELKFETALMEIVFPRKSIILAKY